MTDRTSFGVVLFNPKGELLVIKRPFSYAISSFFSLLLLKETTAERPDQVEATCRRLLPECTPSELNVLKENWNRAGLSVLLEWYLKGLSVHEQLVVAANRIRKEFKREQLKVPVIWRMLVESIDLSKIEADGRHRIHDFPKGRHCKSWKGAVDNFKFETGIDLPSSLDYKEIITVDYTSEAGMNYKLQLFIAEVKWLKMKDNYVGWIPHKELKVHEKIREALQEAH